MKRYRNPHGGNARRTLWDLFLWKAGYYDDPVSKRGPPADFIYPAHAPPFERDRPSAVWIGHSSYLIEVEEISLLTDPVWDSYCSPVPLRGLRRRHDPPISLADLPPIDFVLISHNHYDHLDVKTVRHLHAFHPGIQWIAPLGLAPWFHRQGITKIQELGWWQNFQEKGCRVTAVPAQHFSGRSLFDQNKTLWCGYVFEVRHKRLYFAGDTGYNPVDFKSIGDQWPSMDLSLLPIGTYVPQKFMQPVHCSPFEAVEIHCDVHSCFSLGMHWNTFRLSDEPMDRPPYDLFLAMNDKNLAHGTFLPIDLGVYVNW